MTIWIGRRLVSIMAAVSKRGLVTIFNVMAQCVARAPGRRHVWQNMSGGAMRWRHRDPCDPKVQVFRSKNLKANLFFICEIDVFNLVSSSLTLQFFNKLSEWYHTIGLPFSPYDLYLAALFLHGLCEFVHGEGLVPYQGYLREVPVLPPAEGYSACLFDHPSNRWSTPSGKHPCSLGVKHSFVWSSARLLGGGFF